MMGGYWYVGPASDGRRFCWAKEPSFRCPIHEDAYAIRREGSTMADGLATRAAAGVLGVDPRWLAMRIAGGSHGRTRVDGKLTDRCHCGVKMERLGFAYWTEREAPERTDAGAELTRHMFGNQPTEQLGERRYADTKREAQVWAREELKIAKVAAV
jgi:hypothetical protein